MNKSISKAFSFLSFCGRAYRPNPGGEKRSPPSSKRTFLFCWRKFSMKVARLASPPSLLPAHPHGSYSPKTLALAIKVTISPGFTSAGCALATKIKKLINKNKMFFFIWARIFSSRNYSILDAALFFNFSIALGTSILPR